MKAVTGGEEIHPRPVNGPLAVYVQKLVTACREKVALARATEEDGWQRDYAADVSMLLVMTLTYHTVLRTLLGRARETDKDRILVVQAIGWAEEWLAVAGDPTGLNGEAA